MALRPRREPRDPPSHTESRSHDQGGSNIRYAAGRAPGNLRADEVCAGGMVRRPVREARSLIAEVVVVS